MKKILVVLMMAVMILSLAAIAFADDVTVEKFSLVNIDYGEKAHSKDAYYIAYIKNNTKDALYINSFNLSLYGEDGEALGITDSWPYYYGSLYLDPGETTCVSFLTYYGDNNYDKNAVSAILKCECVKDERYKDVNLDISNSTIKCWFDSSKYSMYATIKNDEIKDTNEICSVALVAEDQNGNPIFMDALYHRFDIPRIGKEFTAVCEIDDTLAENKILKDYYSKNNITPIKVNAFCYYEVGEGYNYDDSYLYDTSYDIPDDAVPAD